MTIEQIQKFLRTGRYIELLEVIETAKFENNNDKFIALSYKSLICCLRGQMFTAEEIISSLKPISKEHEFIIYALNSVLLGYQGKEKKLYENFDKGMELLSSVEDRSSLVEWEAWFHYGIGSSEMLSFFRFDRPILPHLTTTLEKLQELPDSGGVEWAYQSLGVLYGESGNLKKYSEILESLKSYSISHPSNPNAKILATYYKIIGGALKQPSATLEALLDEALENKLTNLKLFTILAWKWHALGVISLWKGEYDQSEKYYEKGLQLAEDYGFCNSGTWLMYVPLLINAGKAEKALAKATQWYEIANANQSKTLRCLALSAIATAHASLQNFKEYLNKRIESLELAREIKSLYFEYDNLIRLGNFFSMSKHDLSTAIQHYQEALDITLQMHQLDFEVYGKYTHSITMYDVLSNAYATIGEYTKALYYLQEATDLAKQIAEDDEIADHPGCLYGRTSWHYHSVGDLFYKIGSFAKAKHYYEKSKVTFSQGYDDPVYYWTLFFSLVLTYSELGELEEAEKNLIKLKECSKKTEEKSIKISLKIAEGVLLKKKPRITMKAKALEIFKTLSLEKDLLMDQKLLVFFNLVELLLWELSSTSHESVLIDIEETLDKIIQFAQEVKSPVIEVEIGIIRSKFEIIQGNTSKALARLHQLQQYAIEKKFDYLQEKINLQLEEIKTNISKWKTLVDKNTPLIDRIHESEVEEYLSDALRIVKGIKQPSRRSSPS